MQRSYLTASIFALALFSASLSAATPASARNMTVESTLQNYGDVSVFYQALMSSGVVNELSSNTHYTIFAPTNAAFAQALPDNNGCLYSDQCRSQLAMLVRDHIVADDYSLPQLAKYGQGLQTLGTKHIVVIEQYKDSYTVNGQNILSDGHTGPDAIYRINGLLADPQELAQYRAEVTMPSAPVNDTITVQKTVTRRNYQTPAPVVDGYHSDMANPYPLDPDTNTTVTTTVIKRYDVEQ